MKQYLILLKSSDFIKDGSTWVTQPINLYSNNSYTNYSYKRANYGLDLIGDTTFVGMEVASPSTTGVEATPYFTNSIYVTDYGEVVYDTATPSIKRFVDLSSRVDILAYKHSFVNYNSESAPNFSIDFFQSDTGDTTSGYDVADDPQWMKAPASSEIGTLFIRRAKQYLRIKLDIDPNGSDISDLGLIFYLEIGIHEPSVPALSLSVKSILERFPSWTAVFEDSVDSATPKLDLPKSTAGELFNALLQNYLDKISREIQLEDINSYILSANENMLAWVYVCNDVLPNTVSIYGDGIELAKAASFVDFFESRPTDHISYYDEATRRLYTIRNYNALTLDGSIAAQEPMLIQNDFDEFGARVSLPRLYLESNANYKKRILDVSKNRPVNNLDSFKKTLRRELDIWRVYGATPDSDYLGATPEVLEISDLQSTSPYFESNGIPNDKFIDLVTEINEKYPTNMGYVRWDEGSWDYGGVLGEGLSRIPAVYDHLASPLGDYYKPGVGDLSDAKLSIDNDKNIFNYTDQTAATVSFDGHLVIDGSMETTPTSYYPTINVPYSWYVSYERTVSDTTANTASAELVYEINVDPYGTAATPATFYLNINEDTNSKSIVTNEHVSSHSASPEFNYIRIFENTGFTNPAYIFKDKISDEKYSDYTTPSIRQVALSKADKIRVQTGKTWSQSSQSYSSNITSNDYKVRLTGSSPSWTNADVNTTIDDADTFSSSTPSQYNIEIGSNKYNTTTSLINSDSFNSEIVLNDINNLSSSSKTTKRLNIADMINPIIHPADATVKNLFIDVPVYVGYVSYDGEFREVSGGIVTADDMDYSSPGVEVLVPSSPNITYKTYNASDVEIDSGYLDSATIDYEAAIVSYLEIETVDSDMYPFDLRNFVDFSEDSSSNVFSGFIDRFNNTYRDDEVAANQYFNEDKFLEEYIVSRQDFTLDAMPSPNYHNVERITFVSSNDKVRLYTDDISSAIQGMNSAFVDGESATVNVYAEKKVDDSNPYTVSIEPGWVYYGEDEHFIYVNETVQTATGRLFELELDDTPKMGAPLIVKVDGQEYRNVFFADEATPSKHSFSNKEIVKGNFSDSLFVSYENVSNLSVKDLSTGHTLFENLSSSTNEITPFSQATPAVIGRNYEVSYLVNDAYFVDKDVYDPSLDTYASTLYLSSTPSTNSSYEITYESDDQLGYKHVDLEIDSLDNPLDEGFIYLSDSEYDFSKINYVLSPGHIKDNRNDLMNISIISYDTNSNVKGGQTFRVYGDNIAATPEYITTNENGFGKGIVRYSGSIPAATPNDTFNIEGIGSSTPNGGSNSSSQGYNRTVPFKVTRSTEFGLRIKAVALSKSIGADGVEDVVIVGQVYWNGKPLSSQIDLTVKAGNNMYDTLASSSLGTVQTDNDGSFKISSLITVSDRQYPGIRFAAVEFQNISAVEQILTDMGEVLDSSDITIGGELVYWNEVYDNITYAAESIAIPRGFTPNYVEEAQLYTTPSFRYLHSTMASATPTGASANWEPPQWVPIPRYSQYQMGLLGNTPEVSPVYTDLHPDHEED